MVTLKVSEDARQLLRILAAHKGKSMYDVAEDLFRAEAKRLKLLLNWKRTNDSKLKGDSR